MLLRKPEVGVTVICMILGIVYQLPLCFSSEESSATTTTFDAPSEWSTLEKFRTLEEPKCEEKVCMIVNKFKKLRELLQSLPEEKNDLLSLLYIPPELMAWADYMEEALWIDMKLEERAREKIASLIFSVKVLSDLLVYGGYVCMLNKGEIWKGELYERKLGKSTAENLRKGLEETKDLFIKTCSELKQELGEKKEEFSFAEEEKAKEGSDKKEALSEELINSIVESVIENFNRAKEEVTHSHPKKSETLKKFSAAINKMGRPIKWSYVKAREDLFRSIRKIGEGESKRGTKAKVGRPLGLGRSIGEGEAKRKRERKEEGSESARLKQEAEWNPGFNLGWEFNGSMSPEPEAAVPEVESGVEG